MLVNVLRTLKFIYAFNFGHWLVTNYTLDRIIYIINLVPKWKTPARRLIFPYVKLQEQSGSTGSRSRGLLCGRSCSKTERPRRSLNYDVISWSAIKSCLRINCCTIEEVRKLCTYWTEWTCSCQNVWIVSEFVEVDISWFRFDNDCYDF